jgi:hypothetical protein
VQHPTYQPTLIDTGSHRPTHLRCTCGFRNLILGETLQQIAESALPHRPPTAAKPILISYRTRFHLLFRSIASRAVARVPPVLYKLLPSCPSANQGPDQIKMCRNDSSGNKAFHTRFAAPLTLLDLLPQLIRKRKEEEDAARSRQGDRSHGMMLAAPSRFMKG